MDNINETEVLEPKKKKAKFYLPISALVVYLMVASFLATGVNFSKYITGTNGGDDARIAKFDVNSKVESDAEFPGVCIDYHYYDNKNATYDFVFTLDGSLEVSVNYKIIVHNVPDGLLVSLDDQPGYNGAKGLYPENVVNGYGTVTFTSGSPELNIDIDNDEKHTPDRNIDSNGDGIIDSNSDRFIEPISAGDSLTRNHFIRFYPDTTRDIPTAYGPVSVELVVYQLD